MKQILITAILLATVIGSIAEARYTRSYMRSNGTYVQGYYGN
jgi:hypothetical protein